MANGDMLPIIVFALFVGIMLAKLGTRGSVVANFFSQFNDVMMEMTMADHEDRADRCVLPDRTYLCNGWIPPHLLRC